MRFSQVFKTQMILKAYVSVESVWHEFKFSIGWDEWNGAIILKSGQADTLVELNVFQFHRFALAACNNQNNSIYSFLAVYPYKSSECLTLVFS